MQIVIDIPENVYKEIYSDAEIIIYSGMRSGKTLLSTLLRAVRKGTPLPKGHGRLIDENALKTYIDNCDCCVGCEDESYGCADKCRCPDYLDEGMERIINNQPTIIEADKGADNG